MTTTTSIGTKNWRPELAVRYGRRSEKRSEPECPCRGVFRLALQRVLSDLGERALREGFGGMGKDSLRGLGPYFTVECRISLLESRVFLNSAPGLPVVLSSGRPWPSTP